MTVTMPNTKPTMLGTFPSFQGVKILVVGDVMLDRYWIGAVERISPEAPVPVVRVERTEERLGGAANVARNAAILGAAVSLLSVVGKDEAGDTLRSMLDSTGIEANLHVDPTIKTTVKLRVLGRQQQLLRIDFEDPPGHEVLSDKLSHFNRSLDRAQVLVFSDYGKGGLTHIRLMIETAKQLNKTILVDPKGSDYTRYRGVDIITPNRDELTPVVGHWKSEEELALKVSRLRKDLEIKALLLTRSEEGMSLFEEQGVTHIPAEAREVFDVSGAGDTVIATLAAALAGGSPLIHAVAWANRAAGIVVGKLGTATVTIEELKKGLL